MSQDREMHCDELAWYLLSRDSSCGVRSSLGGQIEAIGRGGAPTTPNTDLYNHAQSDFASSPSAGSRGAFYRDRLMLRRWSMLSWETQAVLIAHYVLSMPVPANPEREHTPGKAHPRVRYSRDYSTVRYLDEYTARSRFPVGVESRLGKLAGVALYLAGNDLDRVLTACEKGNEDGLRGIKKRSEAAIRAAHKAYYAAADACPAEGTMNRAPHWDGVREMACETFVEDVARARDGVWRQMPLGEVADLGDYE